MHCFPVSLNCHLQPKPSAQQGHAAMKMCLSQKGVNIHASRPASSDMYLNMFMLWLDVPLLAQNQVLCNLCNALEQMLQATICGFKTAKHMTQYHVVIMVYLSIVTAQTYVRMPQGMVRHCCLWPLHAELLCPTHIFEIIAWSHAVSCLYCDQKHPQRCFSMYTKQIHKLLCMSWPEPLPVSQILSRWCEQLEGLLREASWSHRSPHRLLIPGDHINAWTTLNTSTIRKVTGNEVKIVIMPSLSLLSLVTHVAVSFSANRRPGWWTTNSIWCLHH